MEIVEAEAGIRVDAHLVEDGGIVVPDAVPADAHTDGGRPPFAEVRIDGQADVAPGTGNDDAVDTAADAEPGVVEGLVGLIGTADDLRIRIQAEEACHCKYPKNHLDTFHNIALSLCRITP